MAAFLSDAWMSDYVTAMADLPQLDGCDAVIQYVVSGAPDGKVNFFEVIESGQTTEVTAGKRKDADITITWKYAEAVAEHDGERSVEVAYMAARSKIEGDARRYLIDLLPMRRTEQYRSARAHLAETTEF